MCMCLCNCRILHLCGRVRIYESNTKVWWEMPEGVYARRQTFTRARACVQLQTGAKVCVGGSMRVRG